ncbi:MAG: TQO small subunit DoxD [Actinomycetota bacterium]|nr:TQO small subunit DoxD [Actinomycetota bacterium]
MTETVRPTDEVVPDRIGRVILGAFRITVGMLWLVNAGWKRPPDFGENSGRGLYGFTTDAVEHEVFPPFAWLVREAVLPNFRAFGWGVLIVEAALGAFLTLGLLTRLWALVGVGQAIAIALSVLNAPDEWPWSYYLMVAANLVLFAIAAGRYVGLDGVLRPVWAQRDTWSARMALRWS